jgi:DNA polymerase I-like protein with 3'-5' exonuclease and polymerase domains
MEPQLIIIRDPSEIPSLIQYLSDKEVITFDTETTGLHKDSLIIGFSVCAELDRAYYIITREWDPITSTLCNLPILEQSHLIIQALIGRKLIMQNGLYDCRMVKSNYNIDLLPSLHTDTLILGHLLNENRSNALKERGTQLFGLSAKTQELEMKESVSKNGGSLTKDNYELYKGDSNLIALYGAKDALLTLQIFYHDLPILFEEGLDKFFYEEESMPLLKGPTYDLNTTGLKVDTQKLQELKLTLEADCAEAEAFILKEIQEHIKDKYPDGDFKITSNQQIAWLLFIKLGREFNTLTDGGLEMCEKLNLKRPYSFKAKRQFIDAVTIEHKQYLENKAQADEYQTLEIANIRDRLKGKELKVARDSTIKFQKDSYPKFKRVPGPEAFISVDEEALTPHKQKYKWVEKLLQYKKNIKLLSTYVEGIGEKVRYGIINPSFNQSGTTSGRYSSNKPNFQNLPRDDKRIKACIVARTGKAFIGADYSQLEPRVFASFAQDERLLKCFEEGDDFYSVIGVPVFGRIGLSFKKDEKGSFADKYPNERQDSKTIALAAFYGTTPFQMARTLDKSTEEAADIMERYFDQFPSIKEKMLEFHSIAKEKGAVKNLFGRPRRIPDAMKIKKLFGNTPHSELDYEYRSLLNLAVNHPIQSTGASIMNRAAIAFYNNCRTMESTDQAWKEVKIVIQVHDEIIVEAPEHLKEDAAILLKSAMEDTTQLPGVKLIAKPVIAYNLADLK